MTRDEALAKIKKCLALAKSPNPHEAAAAMRQAQALMTMHNIDDQDVSMADVAESKVYTKNDVNVKWLVNLIAMVADAFGCRRYIDNGFSIQASGQWVRHRSVVFVGVGSAASVAAYAYDVLYRQCAQARLEHIRQQPKNCKRMTKIARGDQFALGWVWGVQDLLDKFVSSDRNQELLLSYMSAKHPDLKNVKAKDRAVGRNVRDDDVGKGFHSGKRAQLQRGVGVAAAQGLLL
ncbi:MAG: putative phage associated protein [Comamonadaceae bacterium]|nr:MAG: putative phage associated protein [Comamonadaceae bacterium]